MSPTYAEIADDFALWSQYVDPDGHDTREAFDAMDLEERIAIITRCCGREEPRYRLELEDRGNAVDLETFAERDVAIAAADLRFRQDSDHPDCRHCFWRVWETRSSEPDSDQFLYEIPARP